MRDAGRAELLSRELDRFVRIVSAEMSPERIIVFGSAATADIGEWSDLDVVAIMETDLPFLERLQLVLRRVSPKVTLDLFVYRPKEWAELEQTRPFIRDEIDAKGAADYERPGTPVG